MQGADRPRDGRIDAIARSLSRHQPREVPLEPEAPHDPLLWRASVALVVRPASADLEVLLIRRAVLEGDPWSGHVALPGGRRDPEDRTAADTAVRETLEEVGIDLTGQGRLLGRLDDVTPRRGGPPVAVSSFVFAVPEATGLRLNSEVESALWVPLGELTAPSAATEYLHTLAGGGQLRFPAIGYRRFVIWGLTHRILTQFFEIALGAVEGESP